MSDSLDVHEDDIMLPDGMLVSMRPTLPEQREYVVVDNSRIPEIGPRDNSENWERIPDDEFPSTYRHRDGFLGEAMEYMGGHPISTVGNFLLPMAVGLKWFNSPDKLKQLGGAATAGGTFGVLNMSDPLGSLEESLLPSLNHPGDAWKETVWNKRYENMARHPEEYAE